MSRTASQVARIAENPDADSARNDLYLQFVIPEPSTATLLLLGLSLAARRQRRPQR